MRAIGDSGPELGRSKNGRFFPGHGSLLLLQHLQHVWINESLGNDPTAAFGAVWKLLIRDAVVWVVVRLVFMMNRATLDRFFDTYDGRFYVSESQGRLLQTAITDSGKPEPTGC